MQYGLNLVKRGGLHFLPGHLLPALLLCYFSGDGLRVLRVGILRSLFMLILRMVQHHCYVLNHASRPLYYGRFLNFWMACE
jgi:hypothetical protein